MSVTLKQVIVFQTHSSSKAYLMGGLGLLAVSALMGSISWSNFFPRHYLAMQ